MNCKLLTVVCALASLSGGCLSPNATKARASWQNVCYVGMANDIESIVSSAAVDCGLLAVDASDALRFAARRCAADAYASGQPFKFGYRSFGEDSAYCHIGLRSVDGQLWSMYTDMDVLHIGGGETTVSVSRCKSLRLEPGTRGPGSFFRLDGCEEAQDVVDRIVHKTDAKP